MYRLSTESGLVLVIESSFGAPPSGVQGQKGASVKRDGDAVGIV